MQNGGVAPAGTDCVEADELDCEAPLLALQARDALLDQRDVARAWGGGDVGLERVERVGLLAELGVREAEAAIATDVAGIEVERFLIRADGALEVADEQPLVAAIVRTARAGDRRVILALHCRGRRCRLVRSRSVVDDELGGSSAALGARRRANRLVGRTLD